MKDKKRKIYGMASQINLIIMGVILLIIFMIDINFINAPGHIMALFWVEIVLICLEYVFIMEPIF